MPAEREPVLLVDDSPDELQMLVETIEAAGFQPIAASGGALALRLVQQMVPRLIVLDAVMPGIDGFDLCRRLKQDPLIAPVPIVFMTGLTDTRHVIEGLQAGAVDYVVKPVIMEELVARIRVHIANARAAEGARIGLDATGRHLLALGIGGVVRWGTPQAATSLRRLVEALPGQRTSRIVNPVTGNALKAEFLCSNGSEEFLFRLAPAEGDAGEARLIREFELTGREAEVTIWTARGKSNREISEILGISPRTVNKHLERIFMKLGVENRAAATSVVMRLMLGDD
jgi:DNA-binding response OmpR family regulator/DNA-binding CsgD family transcriptional regulator